MRWGSALAVVSAVYQFATNLHTVPITGRTQVVVLSREEECVSFTCKVAFGVLVANHCCSSRAQELGDKTVTEMIESSDVIESGSRHRMCVDVASYVVLFVAGISVCLQTPHAESTCQL